MAVPVLLASLMHGDDADVNRRLRLAADRTRRRGEGTALADIALVANRPEISDVFYAKAGNAPRPQVRAGPQAVA